MAREIVVQGSAEIRVPPDRALIHLAVDADGSTRDDAYRAAFRSTSGLDAVLEQHAEAIERTVTDALTVLPLTRWKKGEAVRTGWRATRRSTVEVVGFDRLGELLAEVAAWATVSGPVWRVDDSNPAYVEVRHAAAQEARGRARAYAAGLDVDLGPVAWIAEPGLRPGEGFGRLDSMAFAAQGPVMRGGAVDEEIIDVSPQDSVVTATVEVGFAIVDP